MKYSPILSATKAFVAKSTLSGLIIFNNIIFLNLSHFYSHSPGKLSVSGVAHMNQRFHSFELWTNAPIIPVKFGIRSKSFI